jgi:hypothetical protein
MRNHEVPFFHLKTAFEHYIADISTAFSSLNKRMPASMKLKKPLTFLLVIADVDKYARLLRLLDFANFMAYEFRFSLHQPPFAISRLSTLEQSELLVPFERLRGVATCQTVSLVGPFHPKTVKRVKQAMTQNVAWLRAGAWEIYEIALSIKRMGDWAFLLKNADMALAKYHDTHSFMDTARALNSMMEGADLECEKAFRILAVTTKVDTALLMLTGFALVEMGREGYTAVTKLAAQIAATGFEAQTGNTVVCQGL